MKLIVLLGLVVSCVGARSNKHTSVVNESVESGARYVPAMGAEMVGYINADDSIPFYVSVFEKIFGSKSLSKYSYLPNALGQTIQTLREQVQPTPKTLPWPIDRPGN